MAAVLSNNPNNGNNNNTGPSNDSWKAQGFLNLYLPSKDGSPKKLGAIALRDNKPNERDLRAWLEADPSRVAAILSKLTIVYQSAEPKEGSGFNLE